MSSPDAPESLTPPRPFFFAESRASTGSLSDISQDPSSTSDSDREQSPRTEAPPHPRQRNHRRRSYMTTTFDEPVLHSSYSDQGHARPPPSSFAFPFQAYPGNPDPGTSIPGLGRSYSRRSSYESLTRNVEAYNNAISHSGSLTDLRPHPPLMSPSLYKNSAAGNMATTPSAIPRNPSTATFRAPFLSPASRPSSSLWAPPTYPHHFVTPSSPSSLSLLAAKPKPPLPSTRLPTKLSETDKPWLNTPERRTRTAWWLTLICMLLGLAAAAILCWHGVSTVDVLKDSQLCSVLDEQFSSPSLDESVWSRDVELGGFGNGEFQMTTSSPSNLYVQNSQLYINPTLTSDTVPNVLDGGKYILPDCTSSNKTACTAASNANLGIAINPVMSARINTKGKKNIKYGRVEIRAKLPRGDWLWPAIWMLPEQDTYGPWPLSGEINIMQSRGNLPTPPSSPIAGSNTILSALSYAPVSAALLHRITGWYALKRTSFDKGFHTYVLEWTEKSVRFWVDKRVTGVLNLRIGGKGGGTSGGSFWDKGGFPDTVQNGSAQVKVTNPWEQRGPSAPFDQQFYLIIDLAAGGTSGWFPDNAGGKPWVDGSLSAMRDFARAQDEWSKTWPESAEDRAFRIDYVKMWEMCRS